MLRRLAEKLSRGRSYRYRLPKAYGGCQMYLSPECGLSYWMGRYGVRASEGLLKNAVETVKSGSVVWDVGANMGLFTFASAGLAGPQGRVFAFEPDALLVRLLRRSARLNPTAAPVEVLPCAVSNSISLARFNIAERSRATNYLEGFGSTQTGGVRESETVVTIPLDWMSEQIPQPDVLKIDVEGAESAVFRGAAQMLKSKRPILLFEVRPQYWDEISHFLLNLGYTLYDSDLSARDRRPLTQFAYNTLALPA
jgi:FkbM family methyltransferase